MTVTAPESIEARVETIKILIGWLYPTILRAEIAELESMLKPTTNTLDT